MKLPRQDFFRLAAGAAALSAIPGIAAAQAYPTRPVRIVVGFPPGGSNDLYARLIAQWLSEHVGQQFFVENRPGAGGNLATEAVTNATADGYTLLLAFSGDAWSTTLYSNLRFNFIRDFEPVASIARGMDALVVHGSVPVRSVPELIAAAKANPGQDHHGLRWRRKCAAYVLGIVQKHGGNRHASYSLSRRRTCTAPGCLAGKFRLTCRPSFLPLNISGRAKSVLLR